MSPVAPLDPEYLIKPGLVTRACKLNTLETEAGNHKFKVTFNCMSSLKPSWAIWGPVPIPLKYGFINIRFIDTKFWKENSSSWWIMNKMKEKNQGWHKIMYIAFLLFQTEYIWLTLKAYTNQRSHNYFLLRKYSKR